MQRILAPTYRQITQQWARDIQVALVLPETLMANQRTVTPPPDYYIFSDYTSGLQHEPREMDSDILLGQTSAKARICKGRTVRTYPEVHGPN